MSSGMRYLLATVGVIFLLIIGIIIFTRGGGPKTATTSDRTAIDLNSYVDNTSAAVQYTIDGPINASENHRQVRITIGPNNRQIDIIKGYQGEILTTANYPNNTDAYSNFLEALTRANFTKERRLAENVSSTAICPLGNRSHFQITENSEDVMNLWTASCVSGSFAGNLPMTTQLFQLQIPDYNTITNNVAVNGSSGSTGLVL